jgi:hypothetical protein
MFSNIVILRRIPTLIYLAQYFFLYVVVASGNVI